jgi:hypothetical protein
MWWKIHILRDGQAFHHEAHSLEAALAVACLLLRDGIGVDRIEGPDGLAISAEALRPLCESAG